MAVTAATGKMMTTTTLGSSRGGDDQIRPDLDAGGRIRPDPEGGKGVGAGHKGVGTQGWQTDPVRRARAATKAGGALICRDRVVGGRHRMRIERRMCKGGRREWAKSK